MQVFIVVCTLFASLPGSEHKIVEASNLVTDDTLWRSRGQKTTNQNAVFKYVHTAALSCNVPVVEAAHFCYISDT